MAVESKTVAEAACFVKAFRPNQRFLRLKYLSRHCLSQSPSTLQQQLKFVRNRFALLHSPPQWLDKDWDNIFWAISDGANAYSPPAAEPQ